MTPRKQLAGFFDTFIVGTKGMRGTNNVLYDIASDLNRRIKSQVPRHVDRMLAVELKWGGL